MKKLAVLFFCCFFLISGRILLSIGFDVVMKSGADTDFAIPFDPALLFVQQEQPAEETSGGLDEEDGWEMSPFRHTAVREEPDKEPENAEEVEVTEPAETASLDLEAISFGGGKVLAVINGRVLSVDEEIDGYRIMTIKRTEVELIKNGEKTLLKLWDEDK